MGGGMGGGMGGPSGTQNAGSASTNTSSAISSWVTSTCSVVTDSAAGSSQLYDCSLTKLRARRRAPASNSITSTVSTMTAPEK